MSFSKKSLLLLNIFRLYEQVEVFKGNFGGSYFEKERFEDVIFYLSTYTSLLFNTWSFKKVFAFYFETLYNRLLA
jgi:hypothetical protein